MQTIKQNTITDYSNYKSTGSRKKTKKLKLKEKRREMMAEFIEKCSKGLLVALLMVIIAMGTCMFINENKYDNLERNLRDDKTIPSSMVDRVINYLR